MKKQRDRSIGGAAILIDEETTRRFNPLKTILFAVHTNYEVRLQFAVQDPSLTTSSTGIHSNRKQGRGPHFTYKRIGRTLRVTSKLH